MPPLNQTSPTYIVAALSSQDSNNGTSYYSGVLIEVSEGLQDRINSAYAIISNEALGIRAVELDVSCIAIAGEDYYDLGELAAIESHLAPWFRCQESVGYEFFEASPIHPFTPPESSGQ